MHMDELILSCHDLLVICAYNLRFNIEQTLRLRINNIKYNYHASVKTKYYEL